VDAPRTGSPQDLLVQEHAALRRVAILVAQGPAPRDVFAAVTREAGELLGAQRTTLLRVESPERALVVTGWSRGAAPPVPAGHTATIDDRGILGRMLHLPQPIRIEDFDQVGDGEVAALMRRLGISSAAAGPIILSGRVWGALTASWATGASMPAGAEDRVAAFAELVSLAIENAEARQELAASRARLVQAADEARRRIERDLRDGAQQRLVAAALELTVLDRRLDGDADGARTALARVREHLEGGLAELRDLARGIHPAVLTDRGLEAALAALVQRSPIPVELRIRVPDRLDSAIEATVYFLVSEALTNVAKYAQADTVSVELTSTRDDLVATIADDGVGGADAKRGTGLRGLVDRVHAIGGRLEVSSPRGGGTRLRAHLPAHVLGSLNDPEQRKDRRFADPRPKRDRDESPRSARLRDRAGRSPADPAHGRGPPFRTEPGATGG
jgi:signal transduction histidine kinase